MKQISILTIDYVYKNTEMPKMIKVVNLIYCEMWLIDCYHQIDFYIFILQLNKICNKMNDSKSQN